MASQVSPLLASLLGDGSAFPPGLRREAAVAALRDGLPQSHDEAWRQTPLRAMAQRRLRWAAGVDAPDPREKVDESAVATIDDGASRDALTLRNGHADPAQWTAFQLLRGEQGIDLARETVEVAASTPMFDQQTGRADAFARLSKAGAEHVHVLRIRAGARLETPIELVSIARSESAADTAWAERWHVEIGAGASVRIVERIISADAATTLGLRLARYDVAEQAELDLIQIHAAVQSSLYRRDDFSLAGGSRLQLHAVDAGPHWLRHECRVNLDGAGASARLRGATLLGAREHLDRRLELSHRLRDTTSDTRWHAVAGGRSRAIFRGAIAIAPGADGSDARLASKNLLLSDQARIDAQPVLEILTDAVKAAHGATVGRLDETALFYLRSRGISEAAARRLLISAFCNAVFADLDDARWRPHIEAMLAKRRSPDGAES